jgi:hypothetical protein
METEEAQAALGMAGRAVDGEEWESRLQLDKQLSLITCLPSNPRVTRHSMKEMAMRAMFLRSCRGRARISIEEVVQQRSLSKATFSMCTTQVRRQVPKEHLTRDCSRMTTQNTRSGSARISVSTEIGASSARTVTLLRSISSARQRQQSPKQMKEIF